MMRWQSRAEARALHALVQKLRYSGVALCRMRALWISRPSSRSTPAREAVLHNIFAADQNRRAEPLIHEGTAARMTCSSSPSANTTRLRIAAHALENDHLERRRRDRGRADNSY
jgi:hypothetical protein